MHDDRHEAAHEPQPVAVEHRAHGGAVRRQPAQGAELGRRQPERSHLGQHPLGRQLQAPARDLADAPGDRGARQPGRPIGLSARVALLPSLLLARSF